ncbi:MAG: carboxypeptidase-like regulatory domain-containing protein [Candidatus Saccharimonadales bacterium]
MKAAKDYMCLKRTRLSNSGFTIAEMAISIVVVSIVSLSVIGLFTALVKSAVISKRKAVASTLATNQMEYLRSLPYDSLAVAGGSIYSANPLPATTTVTLDNVKYSVKTAISYVDDAFDGCGNYPTQQLKQTYCRNYPAPAGAPAVDSNPQDYKIADVSVSAHGILASVDTQISAKVAETASTTGALFVTVIDDSGNPVSGANVNLANASLSPSLNLNDNTDENGVAIFYGLPPDSSGNHYVITASLTGYSTLATIVPNGSLQPNYLSQNILTQQSSSVTLVIKPMTNDSLVLETTDSSGNPLAGVKVYAKGGYKKYASTADTSYYFDNFSPSDSRPTTDGSGLASMSGLVPGPYVFCGDTGATNCKIGGTTYYLVAAIPYTSPDANNPFAINIPTYSSDNPPATTFT